jgi:hypothetical protein
MAVDLEAVKLDTTPRRSAPVGSVTPPSRTMAESGSGHDRHDRVVPV